jgi:hypothetical protein
MRSHQWWCANFSKCFSSRESIRCGTCNRKMALRLPTSIDLFPEMSCPNMRMAVQVKQTKDDRNRPRISFWQLEESGQGKASRSSHMWLCDPSGISSHAFFYARTRTEPAYTSDVRYALSGRIYNTFTLQYALSQTQ